MAEMITFQRPDGKAAQVTTAEPNDEELRRALW